VDTVEEEGTVRRADGSTGWLHWTTTAVRRSNGSVEYFLTMVEDMSGRHQAEETAMENLAGLERLNKLKSEFVSMVSHEFRTALVGIQGFSELLEAGDNSPQDVVNLATDINNDAQRLNRMIGEMLDLDRMEAGKIQLHPRPLDLNSLITDTIDRLQAATEQHQLTTQLDRALPIVSGDADRLVQVVSNLLTNAIKYSPDGGEILVRTQAENGSVHVSVIDHGIGIAPEFIGRLFGRYERFESNRTSQVVGTGLGLAITREIIELHGGKIWVESKPGEGSNFQFTVPVRT
jgi:signal transduction histidine kinase